MSRRWCAFPGCEVQLHPLTMAGVCKNHMHAPGVCQCTKCLGMSAHRKPIPQRPGVRQTLVPVNGTTMHGDPRRVVVSLRKEPWE